MSDKVLDILETLVLQQSTTEGLWPFVMSGAIDVLVDARRLNSEMKHGQWVVNAIPLKERARTMRAEFTILGTPQGRRDPSARAISITVGGKQRYVAKTYKDPRDRPWQFAVRASAASLFDRPIEAGVPVQISFRAYFALPRSKYRKRIPRPQQRHTSMPDTSNILKGIEDALTGVAWIDDSQAYTGVCEKFVCAQDDNRPRTEVVLEWDVGGEAGGQDQALLKGEG